MRPRGSNISDKLFARGKIPLARIRGRFRLKPLNSMLMGCCDMTASAATVEWLTDALAPLGHIVIKRMFGGAGVYCDGLIFAIVDDDQLYLKTDAPGQAAFVAEGLGPFTYPAKNGPGQLKSYWKAPERLVDDTDELLAWAGRAIAVGRNAAAAATAKSSISRKRNSAPVHAIKKRGT